MKSQAGAEVSEALLPFSGIKHSVRSSNSVIVASAHTLTVATVQGPRFRVQNVTDYWCIIGFVWRINVFLIDYHDLVIFEMSK